MKKALKLRTIQNIKNVGIGAIILVIIAMAVHIWNTTRDSSALSDNRTDLIVNADRFVAASDFLTNSIRAYVTTQDEAYKSDYFNEINSLQNREISIANMQTIGLTAEEESIILQMQSLSNNLVPLESAAIEAVESGQHDRAVELVFGSGYTQTKDSIFSLEVQFQQMISTRTNQETTSLHTHLDTMEIVLISLLVFLLVVQWATEWMMRQVVIVPLCQCTDVITSISKGHLHLSFDRESDTSEIGQLSHATKAILNNLSTIICDLDYSFSQIAGGNFDVDLHRFDDYYVGDFQSLAASKQTIVTELSQTLQQINKVSTQVNISSEEVAHGAASLAEGSNVQSASIQALAQTISSISTEISTTAQDAERAKCATAQAMDALQEGNAQMLKMIDAMDLINHKSSQIRKIIKTIDDIAFQTNILSLNAAVEAARAGSAGRGFAVVADEVRNLATKSAQSAKDTADLIEQTLQAVDEGNIIANDTAQSIDAISAKTSEVSRYMDSINQSSIQQSQSVNVIHDSIDEISSVVQLNSSTSAHSAAASEKLSSHAHMLKSLVDGFTLQSTAKTEQESERHTAP